MCPKIFALTSDIDDERVSNYKKLGFTNTYKELNQSILAEMLAECRLEVREVKESVSQEFSASYRKLYEHEESSRPEGAILSSKSEN